MKCPKCNAELVKIKVKNEDESFKEIFSHPLTASDCEYKSDGINVVIVDEILCNRFQELIKEEGIETPLNVEEITGKKGSESNEEAIKRRLCFGELNISEYDEIKRRLE